MERLTQKANESTKHLQMCIGWYELPTNDYYVRLINETPNQMYRKLGQLEDIEEELGIDLITLFNEKYDIDTFAFEIDQDAKMIFMNGDALYGYYSKEQFLSLIKEFIGVYNELTKEELEDATR